VPIRLNRLLSPPDLPNDRPPVRSAGRSPAPRPSRSALPRAP